MRLSLRYRLLLPLALLLAGDAAATAWAARLAARGAEHRLAEQQWAIVHTLDEPRSTFPLTRPILEQMRGFSGAEFLFVPAAGPVESTFPEPPSPPDVPRAAAPDPDDLHLGGRSEGPLDRPDQVAAVIDQEEAAATQGQPSGGSWATGRSRLSFPGPGKGGKSQP